MFANNDYLQLDVGNFNLKNVNRSILIMSKETNIRGFIPYY